MTIWNLFNNLNANLQSRIIKNAIGKSEVLMIDVKSFRETKIYIKNIYYEYFIEFKKEELLEDLYWLLNDLYLYTDQIQNFWERNFNGIRTDKFGLRLVPHQVNVIWGLMTPDERLEFIKIAKINYVILW